MAYPIDTEWTYSNKRSGHTRTTPLILGWEVNCSPISDDYDADTPAADLLRLWVRRYYQDGGDVSIAWYLEPCWETAPFQLDRTLRLGRLIDGWTDQDKRKDYLGFLADFTWPIHAVTGERVNWLALPVKDHAWRKGNCTKGGFIQEATGWKPGPLQPSVNVGLLLGGEPTKHGQDADGPRREGEGR